MATDFERFISEVEDFPDKVERYVAEAFKAGRVEGIKHAEDKDARKNEALNMADTKLKAEKKAHKELQDAHTKQGIELEQTAKLLGEAQAHIKRLKRDATKTKLKVG